MKATKFCVQVFGIALVFVAMTEAAGNGTPNTKKGCKDDGGVLHPVGSQWLPNACTFCSCEKAGMDPQCASQSCAPLECPEGKVPEIPASDKCCATECVSLADALMDGECNTVCKTNWDPVCGNDGSTYTNMCHFELAQCARKIDGFELLHKGECTAEEEETLKATNSVTSTSSTTKKPTATKTQTAKPTVEDRLTPASMVTTASQSAPMETADWQSISPNTDCASPQCSQSQDKCKPGYRKKMDPENYCCSICVRDLKCPLLCIKTLDPVCGTNGETYSSECDMMSITCEEGKEVSLANKGPCSTKPIPVPPPLDPNDCNNVFCSMEFMQVCGSDGNTYDNLCKLGMASCLEKQKTGNVVYLAHPGVCGSSDSPASSASSSASSQSQPVTATTSTSSSSVSATTIALAVVLPLLLLLAIMLSVICIFKRRKANRAARANARAPAASLTPSEMPINNGSMLPYMDPTLHAEDGKKISA